MRTITATSITEKNKSANTPIYLYTIYAYDGTNNLCLAEYDADVTYDSVTYTRFPITHDFIGENSSGENEQVRVKISNVSRLIQGYLENYDIRAKKVTIKLVWANQLADATACINHTFYIDSYSADEKDVTLTLSSKYNVLDLRIPGRKYSRYYCTWKFKGTECAYAGAETTCNKTFQKCRTLSNQIRFGGFPSIPSRPVYSR